MTEPQRIDQTEFGELGNCQSACLATLLGVRIEDVPNWTAMPCSDNQKYERMKAWLRERGWWLLTVVPWQGIPWPPREGYYIAGGVSPRGVRHAVIFKDGKLWHDPHPERGGIADVQDIDLLMPLRPHAVSTLAEGADK